MLEGLNRCCDRLSNCCDRVVFKVSDPCLSCNQSNSYLWDFRQTSKIFVMEYIDPIGMKSKFRHLGGQSMGLRP